jgi:hypothetical protein
MIRQRNQDVTQEGAMPFLMLTIGAISVIWHLGASLASQTAKVIGRNFGNE